jgi:hypothetical protein
MEKEFVPYELALRMKKLGFDEPCLGVYYTKDGDIRKCAYHEIGDAPTYSQAFRWFREKYNLFGYSYPNDYQTYGYRIVEVKSPENKELIYDWGTNNTNEEAELACLEKLIEIIEGVKE